MRVVIPALLRVFEDNRPALLAACGEQDERVPVVQRIVVVSTLRKGFCLDLRLETCRLPIGNYNSGTAPMRASKPRRTATG